MYRWIRRRLRTAVLLCTVAFALPGCGGKDHLHLLNGFDFPVKVTLTTKEGKSETHEVPPRGRVTTDLLGSGTVKVETKDGTTVAEHKANFGKPKEGKKPCQRAINIEGAAAVVQEGIEYGGGFLPAETRLKAGFLSETFCTASWVFEEPPEAIKVKAHGPKGRTKDWVHYLDDGSWFTAVNALLEDDGQYKSQSRGRAQRIVRAVVAHDPNNPKLEAVKARFKQEGLVYPSSK